MPIWQHGHKEFEDDKILIFYFNGFMDFGKFVAKYRKSPEFDFGQFIIKFQKDGKGGYKLEGFTVQFNKKRPE